MKKQIKGIGVGLAILMALTLPSSGVFAASQSANTTLNGTVNPAISITTSNGTVTMTATPNSVARTSSSNHNVLVSTNNTAGYSLSLQMSTAVRNLVSGAYIIPPSAGTSAVPVATLATNTWGYRIDGGNFGTGPTAVETDVTSSDFKWAGVPALGSPNTIKTTSTTASSDPTTVWYALSVNSSQPTGTYTNIVTYTATTL